VCGAPVHCLAARRHAEFAVVPALMSHCYRFNLNTAFVVTAFIRPAIAN